MFTEYLTPSGKTKPLSAEVARVRNSILGAFRETVSAVFNTQEYTSDIEKFGDGDVWEDPENIISDRRSDCETSAFLAAKILNGLPDGLRPQEVRVTVGKFITQSSFPPSLSNYHAWVEAKIDNEWWTGDTTNGWTFKSDGSSYKRMYAITPDKTIPIGEVK